MRQPDNPTPVGGRVCCGSVSLVMSSVASAGGLTMYANLGEVVALGLISLVIDSDFEGGSARHATNSRA